MRRVFGEVGDSLAYNESDNGVMFVDLRRNTSYVLSIWFWPNLFFFLRPPRSVNHRRRNFTISCLSKVAESESFSSSKLSCCPHQNPVLTWTSEMNSIDNSPLRINDGSCDTFVDNAVSTICDAAIKLTFIQQSNGQNIWWRQLSVSSPITAKNRIDEHFLRIHVSDSCANSPFMAFTFAHWVRVSGWTVARRTW